MRKILMLFLFAPLLCFGQTDSQISIIKKNIDRYFYNNLNDYKSYEPMEFKTLSVYPDDSTGNKNHIKYLIDHKFRAANKMGGKQIYNYRFSLSKELSIIKAVDWEEEKKRISESLFKKYK